MVAACITGLVFISKEMFIHWADGKGGVKTMDSMESVSKSTCMREKKPGTITVTQVRALKSPWFLVRKKPGGEELSGSLVYAPKIMDRPTHSPWLHLTEIGTMA
jgi:hypothetical protein